MLKVDVHTAERRRAAALRRLRRATLAITAAATAVAGGTYLALAAQASPGPATTAPTTRTVGPAISPDPMTPADPTVAPPTSPASGTSLPAATSGGS